MIDVLFEDQYLIVINKPVGWVVNRAQSVMVNTIQDWMDTYYFNSLNRPEYSNSEIQYIKDQSDWDTLNRILFWERSGIVHRLDKDTSGVLVLAKDVEAYLELLRQFREREVRKIYWALVHGKVIDDTGQIDAPVGRLPWNRERFGVYPGGRNAVTDYTVLGRFRDENDVLGAEDVVRTFRLDSGKGSHGHGYSLVECRPKTGRTHQIRVHMKHLGYPIVGDLFYAGRKTGKKDRAWVGRLMLHAKEIEFRHPMSEELLDVRT